MLVRFDRKNTLTIIIKSVEAITGGIGNEILSFFTFSIFFVDFEKNLREDIRLFDLEKISHFFHLYGFFFKIIIVFL